MKERKHMETIIAKEQLQNGILFQGKDYGGIPISFFWMQLPPDEAPRLHFHPYEAEALNLLQAKDTSRDVPVPGALALLTALPPQNWAIGPLVHGSWHTPAYKRWDCPCRLSW